MFRRRSPSIACIETSRTKQLWLRIHYAWMPKYIYAYRLPLGSDPIALYWIRLDWIDWIVLRNAAAGRVGFYLIVYSKFMLYIG